MEGNKIGAMKLLGEETGVGLRQAKDIVDRLSEQLKP
jgi:ribosomal protein L7/L12